MTRKESALFAFISWDGVYHLKLVSKERDTQENENARLLTETLFLQLHASHRLASLKMPWIYPGYARGTQSSQQES